MNKIEWKLYKSRRDSFIVGFLVGPALCALCVATVWIDSDKLLTAILLCGGSLVALYGLIDKKPQIILDEDGIWAKILKRDRIPWEVIKDAHIAERAYGIKYIALVLDEAFASGLKLSRANIAFGDEPLNISTKGLKVNMELLCAVIKQLAHMPRKERATVLAELNASYKTAWQAITRKR